MKRSRSGARPSTGGQKNVARAHVRYKYQLTCVTSEGELVQPTDEDMMYFNEHFPDIAKKLNDCAHNAGFEPGSWQETCFRLVDGLIKQKRAIWFRNPVDPQKEGLPDYFETLSKAGLEPMDLGTVKMRMTNSFYQEPSAFAAAVRLVFTNATTYNRVGTQPHEDASKLLAQFIRKYEQSFAPTSASLPGGMGAASAGDEAGGGAGGGQSAAGLAPASAAGDGLQPSGGGGGASDFSNNEDDDNWGGDAAAASGEQPKAVISDEESDEEEEDDEAGDARRTEGGKAPQSATTEAGKRPATGGKAPAGMDDSGFDETADSEAEMSDSALDSQMESGDEGQGEDGDVSEADMFGDEDEDDGFDFEQNGNGEESEALAGDSEAEGAYGDGYGNESSQAEGDEDDGDDDDDDEEDEVRARPAVLEPWPTGRLPRLIACCPSLTAPFLRSVPPQFI
jgi:hypothetical protein